MKKARRHRQRGSQGGKQAAGDGGAERRVRDRPGFRLLCPRLPQASLQPAWSACSGALFNFGVVALVVAAAGAATGGSGVCFGAGGS